jgi:hemin uptake protein HemP
MITEKPKPLSTGRAVPEKVASLTLLGRSGELIIVHNGREYRLRVTQNGKLILTA